MAKWSNNGNMTSNEIAVEDTASRLPIRFINCVVEGRDWTNPFMYDVLLLSVLLLFALLWLLSVGVFIIELFSV